MSGQLQASGSEGLVCYVCDSTVIGRYYALATCRTQTTKVRLVEKLGQLVGEEYMVVVSEEDVICRACATMINSLDRLEKEVGSLRTVVLKYLEKKYGLEEGELVSTRAAIAPYNSSAVKDKLDSPVDFQTRKRQCVDATEEVRSLKGPWLQCDKCRYTTPFNGFMVQHARGHAKREGVTMKKEPGSVDVTQSCDRVAGNGETETGEGELEAMGICIDGQSQQQVIFADSTTTVVLNNKQKEGERAAETGGGGDPGEDPGDAMVVGQVGPELVVQSVDGNGEEMAMVGGLGGLVGGKQVTLQTVAEPDGTSTLCMVDEQGLVVQKVESAEDGTLYVQVVDGEETSRQVLSVAEDGSVQMILWEDVAAASADPDPDPDHPPDTTHQAW